MIFLDASKVKERCALRKLIFFVLYSIPLITTPQPRDDVSVRATLIHLEEEWLHAHDQATLDRILAADFVHPVPTGDFLTKTQHIDWLIRNTPHADQTVHFEDLKVRVCGDVGIVNGTVVSNAGRKTVFTDVFVYRGKRWQAVNAQENPVGPP